MRAVAQSERMRIFHPGLYLKKHPMSRVFQSYSPISIKVQNTTMLSHLQLICKNHILLMRFSSSINLTKINRGGIETRSS